MPSLIVRLLANELKRTSSEQVNPVAGKKEDSGPAEEELFSVREFYEPKPWRAGDQDDKGVDVEDDKTAISDECEGIEEEGSGEMTVEKLVG
jgi:hypothetical protein